MKTTRTNSISRSGYTAVDLVAGIGCVALLLAILMPAVLHARGDAKDLLCQSRMKALGVALHNYHERHQVFPPGWVTAQRDAESSPGYGWIAQLLPFINQVELHSYLSRTPAFSALSEQMKASLIDFQCPADGNLPSLNPIRGGFGTSSYSGNLGSVGPIRWSDGRMEAYWPGSLPTLHNQGNIQKSIDLIGNNALSCNGNGVFGWNSSRRTSDIADGLSNTIAFGERSRSSGWGLWLGVGANRFENDVVTDVGYASPINRSLTGYSSEHAGGVYFCMADGAVRFVSNNINSQPADGVLQLLGSCSDRMQLPSGIYADDSR